MSLAVYVSGHGFGHATRVAEVLRVVRERAPDLRIEVATSAPASLFAGVVANVSVRPLECDVGLVQGDALQIDEEATAVRWTAFRQQWDALCADEADRLRRSRARLVLGDVPPLAFEAARRAGVPSVALANFSWDWIYRHLAARVPALEEAAGHAAAAYAHAERLLRLPFAGDLSAFPKIVDIPLVARRPRAPREVLRQRLGFGRRPVVMMSFGGLGLPGFDVGVLGLLDQWDFVVSTPLDAAPSNVRALTAAHLAEFDLGYVDLVGAVDVVVTKPGYGIVTDALGARTALVYTDRGDFPEYEILVQGMRKLLPCAYVNNESLRAGRLAEPILEAMRLPWPAEPDLSGARVAAHHIVGLVS